jgi:hypothetical protein
MNYKVGQKVRFIKTENPLLTSLVGREATITAIDPVCPMCKVVHRDDDNNTTYEIEFVGFSHRVDVPPYHIEPIVPPKKQVKEALERIFLKTRESNDVTA